MRDAGVNILLGTDEVPWIGSITRELHAMVRNGLTPYEALLTGTRNVAEYFGTEKETGTLAVSKVADMILLRGNPLDDVRHTAHPEGVMLTGRWLSRAEIDRRVSELQLPTFEYSNNPNLRISIAPIKTYWRNVADELNMQATHVYNDMRFDVKRTDSIKQMIIVHLKAQQALVDSIGFSHEFDASAQRLIDLLGMQLSEYRAKLNPWQKAQFDPRAKNWIALQRRGGYGAKVEGVH